MAAWQARIVVFRGPPADPGIVVLQGVAAVLLGVEACVFKLPASASGLAEPGDGSGRHGPVGQVDTAAVGWLAAVLGRDEGHALQPLQRVVTIVEVGDPATGGLDDGTA
jgi:hypothetical protein